MERYVKYLKKSIEDTREEDDGEHFAYCQALSELRTLGLIETPNPEDYLPLVIGEEYESRDGTKVVVTNINHIYNLIEVIMYDHRYFLTIEGKFNKDGIGEHNLDIIGKW